MSEAGRILQEKFGGLAPRVAIVLGSGLGNLVEAVEGSIEVPFGDLPDMPVSGVEGHAGRFVGGTFAGVPVVMVAGRVHYYEHGRADEMRPVLDALQEVGVDTLFLSNAAGSLRTDLEPGSVMLITDHINFSGSNPLFGEATDRRFVNLTEAYDRELCDRLRAAAREVRIEMGEGVYMWFSGPSFETPAEIRMAQVMGADAVGMSTVPEVIMARFLGMRVAACSVITNFGAGMDTGDISHDETQQMAPIGGGKLRAILTEALKSLAV